LSVAEGMRRIQLTYQTKFGLLFISPAALYFAGFWVLPVALAVVASATDWRIGRPAHFIGLSNYAGLVSDPPFHHALLASLKMTGLYPMVFLAGLRSVPREFQEAALMDGASATQVFSRITMPLLRPITVFVVVSGFVTVIGLFEPIFMLTGGGPADATRALPI